MTLLLTAIFRDYKQYWLKILCTIIGVIISLSLFIVIELFSYLFQVPSIEASLNVPYSHKLVHNHGKITQHDIHNLSQHPLLNRYIPYSDIYDYFNHPDIQSDVLVRGTDRFQLTAILSDTYLNNEKTTEIDISPFDLNETFLISKSCKTGSKITMISHLIQKPIQAICIQFDISQPVLLMDIALFQSLYSTNNSVDSMLFSLTQSEASQVKSILENQLTNFSLIALKKEQEQQSKWVNSLTYNLKFLAFISLIVSTCLMIQFFRFLAKQRAFMFTQLFQLGVSTRIIKKIFIAEVGIIALFSNVSALIIAYFIAIYSLDLFNQIITMFYFKLSSTKLVMHWSIILKSILASFGSFVFAYIGYFYGKAFGHHIRPIIKIGFVSLFFISFGIGTIFYYPSRWLVIFSAIAMISGFFGLCVSSISFIGHALRRIKSQRFVAFKMCRDTLLNDPLSYGAIVFVISLSAGLIISMSIFVSSFSNTVKSWLDTVTFHDIYIQHPANTIQNPMTLPSESIALIHQLTSGDVKISTLYRVPFIYNGYPTQIVFRSNIHDPAYSRFIFKEILNGPFDLYDVVISEPFAIKHQLQLGEYIQLNGIVKNKLRIIGIAYDFVSEFGQIIADNNLIRSSQSKSLLHGVAIKASTATVLPSLIPELSQMSGINFATRDSIIDESMTIFNDTFSFTWFVVFLTGCIAIFSLINLLTIVCINRKNEIAQLWHIGFNTNRLTGIILAQVTIIGILSSLISIAIGGCFYILIVYGIQLPTFNWSIFLHIPWKLFIFTPIITLALCLIIGTLFMKIIGHELGKGRVNESIRTTN
tara:strand:+ start:18780 stop:21227 length:2448 start_codon:yes stop_codon:yes gene_type:complete